MASKNIFKHIGVIFIALVPVIYVWAMWAHIPQTVTLHYNIRGEADGFGDKYALLVNISILAGVNLLTYLFLINLSKIDPKQAEKINTRMFDLITIGTICFLSIIGLVIGISSIHPGAPAYEQLITPITGLLLVFLGNFMYSIKPNKYIGIRIPWTLNNDENWKYTHRIGGKLFFAGGVLITIGGILFTPITANILLMCILGIILLVTIGYSYSFHQNNKKQDSL